MINLVSPFEPFFRVQEFQNRNSNIFRSSSAAYYFIEKHEEELRQCGALIRLGEGKRAPILVNERLLLEQCKRWADQQVGPAAEPQDMQRRH